MISPVETTEKKSKRILIVSVVAMFVLLGATLIMLSILNVNSFRGQIASRLSQATGFHIEVQSLELGFRNGLGLKCRGFSVRSQDKKQELFSAEELFLLADLRPLLYRQFRIKKATVFKPVVHINPPIERVKTQPPSPPSKTESEPKQAPRTSPGSKTQGQTIYKFLQDEHLILDTLEIVQGQIQLPPNGKFTPALYEHPINVSAQLQILQQEEGRLDATLTVSKLEHRELSVKGRVRLKDAFSPDASLHIDLQTEPHTSADIRPFYDLLPESVQDTFAPLRWNTDIRKLTLKMNVPQKAVHHLKTVWQQGQARFAFLLKDGDVQGKGFSISFNEIGGETEWKENHLSHNLAGNILGGEFKMAGGLDMAQASQQSSRPLLNTKFQVDGLDLAQIKTIVRGIDLPIEGRVSGSLKIDGPISNIRDLKGQGAFHGSRVRIHQSDQWHKIETISIGINKDSPDNARLDFELSHIEIYQALLNKAHGVIDFSPQRIVLKQGRITPDHGVIKVSGNYHIPTRVYRLEVNGKNLMAEDLLKDHLLGPAEFEGKLMGNLAGKQPVRDLTGLIRINLVDGSIRQLGFIESLLNLVNPSHLLNKMKEGLNYKYLGGEIKIVRGLMTTDNLRMTGPHLKILGVGKADLPTQKLDGEIKVTSAVKMKRVVRNIPFLENFLKREDLDKVLQTNVKVGGTVSHPRLNMETVKTEFKKPDRVFEELRPGVK